MLRWGDFMTLEDFCAQNNIRIVYHNFTTKVKGLCMKVDDSYVVAINPRFSSESMKKTLLHEIMHIMKDHFYCDPAETEACEAEIHKIIGNIQDKIDQGYVFY